MSPADHAFLRSLQRGIKDLEKKKCAAISLHRASEHNTRQTCPRCLLFGFHHKVLKKNSKHQINHYLRPLVDDLKKLYTRVTTSVNGKSNTRIQAALLMVACDIPTARNVSGFTGIGSTWACYKCKRQFSSIPGNHLKHDFSGFTTEDIAAWEER